MRFTFKMLVLIGLVVVGKFLKEDSTSNVTQSAAVISQDAFSLEPVTPALPFTQKTTHFLLPVNKKENTAEKTFTYNLN